MDSLDAAILLQEIVYRKDAKRASPGWYLPDKTILVVQVMDARVAEIARYLDEQLFGELEQTGFAEIWAADYRLIEPHRTVQLLGIKPTRWRGLHAHRSSGAKPYG